MQNVSLYMNIHDILLRKFIGEFVRRLTIMDATFNCIMSLLNNTDQTCHKMISHIESARNEIQQQRTDQQTILMRLMKSIALSWDLMDSSQTIIQQHLKLTKRLSTTHSRIVKLYKIFVEARIQTVVNPQKFCFKNFISDVTDTISL